MIHSKILNITNTQWLSLRVKNKVTNLQFLKATIYKETYFPSFLIKKNLRSKNIYKNNKILAYYHTAVDRFQLFLLAVRLVLCVP